MTFLIISVLALLISIVGLNHSVKTQNNIQGGFVTKDYFDGWVKLLDETKVKLSDLKLNFDRTCHWGVRGYIQSSPIQYKSNREKGEVYELKSNIIKQDGSILAGEKVLIEEVTTRGDHGYVFKDYHLISEKGIALYVCHQDAIDLFVTQKDYEDRIDEANYMLDKELEAVGDDNLIAELMDHNHVLIKENERLTKEIDKCSKMNQEQEKDKKSLLKTIEMNEDFIARQKAQIRELCLQEGMMKQTRAAKKKKP